MHSFNEIGATLTPQLKICRPNEIDIDMWSLPWQHLKKAVANMAAKDRTIHTEEDRTHLKGIGEIDQPINKSIIHGLGERERKVYNHISTGAVWTEQHLQDVGLSDGRCRHCQQFVDGASHILWKCPAINKHRNINDLANIDVDLLPQYIKH